MNAVPAYVVAFFALTTTLYMIDTGRHKTDPFYRLRWIFGSLPFFAMSAAFLWQGYYLPMSDYEFDRYQCMYWSIGAMLLYATIIWCIDIRVRRIKRHG